MKERPILFSGPMVRALLDDRKTQTRRVVKLPETVSNGYGFDHSTGHIFCHNDYLPPDCQVVPPHYEPLDPRDLPCPYGEPGDRLWVRETFGLVTGNGVRVVYRADAEQPPRIGYPDDPITDMKWTPSIYMRRQHSRITLEVTGIRVERLREITEEDAKAEGVKPIAGQDFWSCFCEGDHSYFDMTVNPDEEHRRERGITHVKHQPAVGVPALTVFERLWDSINGKRPGCAWSDNPWVWVVEFRRLP